jgi:hypothetical protein
MYTIILLSNQYTRSDDRARSMGRERRVLKFIDTTHTATDIGQKETIYMYTSVYA